MEGFHKGALRAEQICVAVAALGLVLLPLMTAISRAFPEVALGEIRDVALILLPWLGMVGGAYGWRLGRHPALGALTFGLPPSAHRILKRARSVCAIAYFLLLMMSGTLVTLNQAQWGLRTPALRIPFWLASIAVAVGSLVLVIHAASEWSEAKGETPKGLGAANQIMDAGEGEG